MGWTEAELHAWIARRQRRLGLPLAGSIGHDAAVLRERRGRPVACADQTLEGVHFAPDASPRAIGRKAAGRVLSDLAATAARPAALLCALAADARAEPARLRSVLAALDTEGRKHGAPLIGGDLAARPGPLALAVTALGTLAGRTRPPGRDRARPGQVVLLTGPTGGSALGRHLRIEPRLAEGAWLHARGATALMDVSDGLALDLSRLAAASGVRIDLEEIPVHRDARRLARQDGRDAREHALHDGEDHELIATLPAATWRRIEPAACRRFPLLVRIGRVRAGRGLWLGTPPSPWDGAGGWRHGIGVEG